MVYRISNFVKWRMGGGGTPGGIFAGGVTPTV